MFMNVLILFPVFSFSTASLDSKSFDENVPCDRGYYYFRDKCYRAGGRKASETLSWKRALARCRHYGADLVSINSQEEQDFIVGFLLLDIKKSAWIGLNDRYKEQDFKWTDGSEYNYSIWNANEPSTYGEKGSENCVEMRLYPEREEIGVWNDLNCEVKHAYICEKNANSRKSSPNPMYCTPEEGGGWKYKTSCYRIIHEEKEWQLAEKYCRINYNGHLLTINDMLVDYFLELAIPDIKKEMWIGIQIKKQLQQKWNSNWYVSYERFRKDEKYIKGTCGARKNRTEWLTRPCKRLLPFICEITKVTPPVLKAPPAGAHCPRDLDDWRDLGGTYCYYIETEKRLNFYEANFECQRRGGQMLSLHSQAEADILQPFVRHKRVKIFIGLIRHKAFNDETFGWTDGSALDYENWSHNEPNSVDERCVNYFISTKKWHDIPCESNFLSYICSVKKIVPSSRPTNKTGDCKSFCVSAYSHMFGLISQSPDARAISC